MQILLIEDHDGIGKAMRIILESHGHEMTWADTGKMALETLSKSSFDLILCDIWLPDIDGYRLADMIRARCDTPTVAVSSDLLELNAPKCCAAGFVSYYDKAFDIDEFLQFLDKVRHSHVKETAFFG